MPEHKIKIMAIDDDEAMLDIYETGLSAKDYEVKTFLDPKKGKEYLLSGNWELPDVILMDIMMPDIDGISLMKDIHSNLKTTHIPIIAVSGLNDAATLNDALLFGAMDYLVKPFSIDSLEIKIKKAWELRKKRSSDK
ncbi:MAG: response regulator [Elusimicrobiales bacterium]|nr:response regulator [Elusimicrobiales bacterium]